MVSLSKYSLSLNLLIIVIIPLLIPKCSSLTLPSFSISHNKTETRISSRNRFGGDRKREDPYIITYPKEHPYAVLVYLKVSRSVCSGTLLTKFWVITAKHCVKRKTQTVVYAGGNSVREVLDNDLPTGSQMLRLSKACVHTTLDVALLKVKKGFELSNNINTIPISSNKPLSETIDGIVTGFGRIQLKEKHLLDYTRKTEDMEVVSQCKCYYQRYKDRNDWGLIANEENFMCSLPREDYGVCKGDSGAGLVDDGVLLAVTSSIIPNIRCTFHNPRTQRITCGSRNTSSIFVSLYPLRDWINNTLNDVKLPDSKCFKSVSSKSVSCVALVLGTVFRTVVFR